VSGGRVRAALMQVKSVGGAWLDLRHQSIDPVRCAAAMNRLDLRSLPAQDPMQRALRAADALEPGQALEVLTLLPPSPLLQALDARGLRWRTEPLSDGGAWVAILRPAA
jgi:uncharacterized protein (DUF2249 family)